MVPEKQQDQRQWSRQDIAEKMAEYEKEYLATRQFDKKG
jgi:ribosomal protein L29